MQHDSKYNDRSHEAKERSTQAQIADMSWIWDSEFILINIITGKKVNSASENEALWGNCFI